MKTKESILREAFEKRIILKIDNNYEYDESPKIKIKKTIQKLSELPLFEQNKINDDISLIYRGVKEGLDEPELRTMITSELITCPLLENTFKEINKLNKNEDVIKYSEELITIYYLLAAKNFNQIMLIDSKLIIEIIMSLKDIPINMYDDCFGDIFASNILNRLLVFKEKSSQHISKEIITILTSLNKEYVTKNQNLKTKTKELNEENPNSKFKGLIKRFRSFNK